MCKSRPAKSFESDLKTLNRNGLVPRILKRGVIVAFSMACGGCAWYQGVDTIYMERQLLHYESGIQQQDSYMQQFYQLQQRIDELEKQLNKDSKGLQLKTIVESSLEQKTTIALAKVKARTTQAIKSIDKLLASLGISRKMLDGVQVAGSVDLGASFGNGESDKDTGVAVPHPKPQFKGVLNRDRHGDVISATSDGDRYNYSVVYTYPVKELWVDMWTLLESKGVQDKWRGKNIAKQSYFIYVGAYYTQNPATRRQQSLLVATGVKPEIRIRHGYHAVAAK